MLKGNPILDSLYVKWRWREQKASFGKDNPDKTFFVVRRATCKVGLFSYVMTNMGLVKYALDKGYIPVIDMQGNNNTYLEENEVGIKNAWEYYFEQPCGYNLEDITTSRNIILSSGLITEKNVYPGKEIAKDQRKCLEWRRFFAQYLKVKETIYKEAEELRSRLFGGEKVLGVLCRGSDYVNNRPKNHPIQPDPEDVIIKAKEIIKKYKCRWIYLATEDEKIYQRFYEVFGDELKVTTARRCGDTGKTNINDIGFQRENDKYLKGKEYLINIMLLAKCDCLLAGSVGGTYGALLMSQGYEYAHIYDLGVY